MAEITGRITIHEDMDEWGPFEFDLGPAIPPGTSITTVSVTSWFTGSPGGLIESTSQLVDGPAQIVGSTSVQVRFQWPGSDMAGKHRLVFSFSVSNGAQGSLSYEWVLVKPLI